MAGVASLACRDTASWNRLALLAALSGFQSGALRHAGSVAGVGVDNNSAM